MNEKLGRFVVDRPALTVLVVLMITFTLGFINASPGTFGLTKNTSEREDTWLPDNEIVKADQEISDNYGLQVSYMQIIVKADNILDNTTLIEILELEMAIADVESLQYVLFPQEGNIVSISSIIAYGYWNQLLQMNLTGNMTFDPMALLMSMDQTTINQTIMGIENAEFAQFRPSMVLTKDFPKNLGRNLIKAKGTMILVMLNSSMYDEVDGDYNPPLDASMDVLDVIDDQDLVSIKDTGLIENEYMSYRIEQDSGDAMGILFMGVFLLIIIILFLTYRSVFDTIISIAALMFAITWMDGIGVLLGLTFHTMYQAVPILLMGLGVDYAIHLIMRYREERVHFNKTIRDSLVLTSVSVGAALFLATLTTSISFGSNMVSEIKPMREFAIFALVGIIAAFITMVTFVPAMKMLFHSFQEKRGVREFKDVRGKRTKGGKKKTGSSSLLSRGLAKGAVAAEHHAYTVIVLVVVVSIISTVMAMQLETEFDFTEFLPEGSEMTDDIIYMVDNFDFGTESSNVLVKGDISDPDVLIAMNQTENNILNDRYINEDEPIESILTLMRAVAGGQFIINGSMVADPVFAGMYAAADTTGDGVPDRNIDGLFDYLREDRRYAFSTVRVLHYNDDKAMYDGAVIRVSVNSQNAAKAKDISDDLENDITPLEREGSVDKATVTSGPVLIHYIINSIEVSGMQSLIISIVVAGIILTLVFYITDRSLVLGIITEIPVILVIAWVFASMYIIGMPLNVMTIMIASLTVGLGITYGIHVTHRFVEDLGNLNDIDEATRSTVVNTGTALFGAAITTIGGFGILILSPIPPMKKFGAITALAIFFSLIASIFVLPTFLSLWAKYVKKRDPCYFEHHKDVQKEIEEKALACETPEDGPKKPKTVKKPVKKAVKKPSPKPSAEKETEPSEEETPEDEDPDEPPAEDLEEEPPEDQDDRLEPAGPAEEEEPSEEAGEDDEDPEE